MEITHCHCIEHMHWYLSSLREVILKRILAVVAPGGFPILSYRESLMSLLYMGVEITSDCLLCQLTLGTHHHSGHHLCNAGAASMGTAFPRLYCQQACGLDSPMRGTHIRIIRQKKNTGRIFPPVVVDRHIGFGSHLWFFPCKSPGSVLQVVLAGSSSRINSG